MAIDLARFARLRPFLYHLTAADNLERIRRNSVIKSAAVLMQEAQDLRHLREKRHQHVHLRLGESIVVIRDQAPLYLGNIGFGPGWTFADVIASLNERVFFWPGNDEGPRDYGKRHFERYRDENPAIIRVRTQSMFDCDRNPPPEFCKYNSGSPRCTGGRGSPRNAETFVGALDARYTAGRVVEVTFRDSATLPNGEAEFCRIDDWGNWRGLARD